MYLRSGDQDFWFAREIREYVGLVLFRVLFDLFSTRDKAWKAAANYC